MASLGEGRTPLTSLLGIDHPVIQGPFGGGLSTTRLLALVSNAGGLGSFGAHIVPPAQLPALVEECRSLTTRPFAINLWISDHDPGAETLTADAFERLADLFGPLFAELGLPRPTPPARFHPRYEDQIEALLEAAPPVFSFVFGIPSPAVLTACRHRGILTVGAATSLAEARALDEAGVDAIVATGLEAGGHRPSFLGPAEQSLMGTFALTQLVSRRVKAPIIAAGGIADGRGVRAVLTLGASGAQIGTAFLACEESAAHPAHRAALFSPAAERTVLTRAFSGRLARGLANRWSDELAARLGSPAPFPVQSWFVGRLREAALAADRTDLVSLWGGQIAPNLRHRSAASLFASLVSDLD